MSARSEHRRISCEGKIRHETKWSASNAMRSTCLTGKKQTNGARPNVYFCRYCGGWHWGHGKTPINKAARGQ